MPHLSYSIEGDNRLPKIVFLHGFLGTKEDWRPVTGALNQQFCCVAYDLPGHGESPSLSADFDAQFAEELRGLAPFALVGYSLGGRVAMGLHQQFPELVKRLIILSAHPGLSSEAEKAERLRRDLAWARQIAELPIEEFLANWYAQPVFSTLNQDPILKQALIERRKKQRPADLIAILKAWGLAHQSQFTHFPHPSLFLYGDRDLQYAKLYSTLPASVDVRKVEGCSHALLLEKPQRCAQYILNWLEDCYAKHTEHSSGSN